MSSKRHKAYAKLIRAIIAVASVLYEMIYDEPAPKAREVLR